MSWPRLYYLPVTQEFCEAPPGTHALPVSASTVILKCTYLACNKISDAFRSQALERLRQNPPHAVLWILSSPEGPPFRSAILFVKQTDNSPVERVEDVRIQGILQGSPYLSGAIKSYSAVIYSGQSLEDFSSIQTDLEQGRPGFLVTGTINTVELWRIKRLEIDGLGRNVVTMAPVRPAYGIVQPRFDNVLHPLQGYLTQHFEGLQQALSRSAPFDVIDRAANLTEGILEFCLMTIGRSPRKSLSDKLNEAKKALEEKPPIANFPLDALGYHLAHKIRILHGRLHADQSVHREKEVRPEVGLSAAVDVGELMVGVGLGVYL